MTNENNETVFYEDGSAATEERAAEQPAALGAARVLIVDDDPVMRRSLARLVASDARLHVAGEAANGLEGAELASELKPDVIVMDLRMPVMDGIESTRRIKATFPNVIIVGASAFGEAESKRAMMEAGACVFLDKASAGDALTRAINRCLAACGARASANFPFGGYCRCACQTACVAITA